MTDVALAAPARGRLLVPFPEREVTPRGWVADQLRADVRDGVVGHLDRLAPDLVVADDIFGRDRLHASSPAKDLGARSDDVAWSAQFQWWNAETQGNWRDGWVHHAMWAGDAADREAARAWVDRMLATQDPDGYLGIHGPALRYPQDGEHGELWAQAVLLRALLGYQRHTGDPRVLDAVRRAADRTMAGYPAGACEPFGRGPSFGGVTHGLMLSDVLWELARATGDDRYLTYGAWLYRAFAVSTAASGDAQAAALLEPGAGFGGHGVHTYEHWRALTVAAVDAAERDDPAFGDGLDLPALEAAYADRLQAALTPAGAPNGDESCHGTGTADDTGYELCSVQELLHAFGRRVEASGEVALGDRMESLAFNVAFGMRDPLGPGVAYLRTDNSRSMTGAEGFRPPARGTVSQTRYRFSPLHREAAVCCVPNWGRILPTYGRYQWLHGRAHGRPQVLALLFGASELRTTIDGVPVTVTQHTAYPAETTVRFVVEAAAPASFSLAVRLPGWAQGLQVTGVDGHRIHASPSLVRVDGPWVGRTVVEAWFAAPIEVRRTSSGRLLAQGPILFALPIPAEREVTRRYPVTGTRLPFEDVLLRPDVGWTEPSLAARPDPRPAPAPPWAEAARAPHAWQRRAVAVDMTDHAGRTREHGLVPMGATGLRVAVFKGT